MKKFLVLSILTLIGLTCASLLPQTTSGQKGKFRRSVQGVKDRYIVVMNDRFVDSSAAEPAIASEAAYLSVQFGGEVKEVYSSALKGFVIEMPERAAIALSKDERVEFVEQDALIYEAGTQTAGSWGIDRLDQRTLPLNGQFSWGPDGSGVHAYVIDSGIRASHVDFGGRATADHDTIGDGMNGADCTGHGTHVAGTIGGANYGVAKNVRIHGVRVIPCSGIGMVSKLIDGINWVTANRTLPAVANISITINGPSSVTDTAIQNSVNAGITYVVAAGNMNLDACAYSPARAPSAISVGAVNSDDSKAGFSNWGSCVDVWAPGVGITSASHSNDTDGRGMSGTSMASPHIAGVAALYLSANPSASPATVANSIYSSSTTGTIPGLDPASPNRIAYSWLSGAPTPTPTPSAARVTIRKRTSRNLETTGTSFPYDAANLSTSSFSLRPDNEFVDSNVTSFGSGNRITVTESQVIGWTLTSITCTETSGGGMPNVVNTTIDLANRKADIVAEQGEQIDCTFVSEPLAPTAANATVSGRVVDSEGRGIRGITLSIYDAMAGTGRSVATNTFGYYTFSDLPTGRLYIVSANSTRRITIRNNVRSFTLNESLSAIDFQANR